MYVCISTYSYLPPICHLLSFMYLYLLSVIYLSSIFIYYLSHYLLSICMFTSISIILLPSIFIPIHKCGRKHWPNNHSEWSNENSNQASLSFYELSFANLVNKIRVREFIFTWIWSCGLIWMYSFEYVELNSKGDHGWQEWTTQHSVCLLAMAGTWPTTMTNNQLEFAWLWCTVQPFSCYIWMDICFMFVGIQIHLAKSLKYVFVGGVLMGITLKNYLI